MKKAMFLDRDGVINVDKGYVYKWEDFQLTKGCIEALKRIQILNYKIIIVTNQSGIARGYYTEKDYQNLNSSFLDYMISQKINITASYHCPHHPLFSKGEDSKCNCRKPKPGMFLKAAEENDILLSESIAIGDQLRDLLAAKAAGINHRYLISQNNDLISMLPKNISKGNFNSLYECIKKIN
tara:strand:+ start:115 stop:660 length:546 start_codon:yes stop_codon:yes gene_type:complete